jgi:hypothetical protein
MRTAIFIPDIDNYSQKEPEIWNLCYPSIQAYAQKIKADLIVLTKRKFPQYHYSYEKHQVYELGKSYEWNIVMDADILIHSQLPDLTERIPSQLVGLRDTYNADSLFRLNDYFFRDRRKIGVSSTFAMASKICHDLWTPLEFTQEEINQNITPWPDEVIRGVVPEHFTAEYWLSTNLARFGLTYSGILHEQERWMFHHAYAAYTSEAKFKELKKVIYSWS